MFKFQITAHDNILILKRLEDSRSKELRDETNEYFKEELNDLMENVFVETDGWDLNGSQIAIFKDSKALKEYLEEFVRFLNKNHAYSLHKKLSKGCMRQDDNSIVLKCLYGDFILYNHNNIYTIRHTFHQENFIGNFNDVVELSNHFKTIYPKEIFLESNNYHIINNTRIGYFRDTILDLMDKLPKIKINKDIIDNIGEYIGYWDYFDNLENFLDNKSKYFQRELDYNEISC